MQDKDLKNLKNIPVEPPSGAARKAALSAAMRAFEAERPAQETIKTPKKETFFQGTSWGKRLTDSFIQIRSFKMNKTYAKGMATASVFVIAGSLTYGYSNDIRSYLSQSLSRSLSEKESSNPIAPLHEEMKIAVGKPQQPISPNTGAERYRQQPTAQMKPEVKKERRATSSPFTKDRADIGASQVSKPAPSVKTPAPKGPVTGKLTISPVQSGNDGISEIDLSGARVATTPKAKPSKVLRSMPTPQMIKDHRARNAGLAGKKRWKPKNFGGKYNRNSQLTGSASRMYVPQDLNIIPETQNRDKFANKAANPVKITATEPVSTFSIDVDTASYAFMRRSLNAGRMPAPQSIRIEELINYFDYNYVVPDANEAPFKPTIAIYPTPWNKNTKLLHIGIKGHDIVKTQKPRANLVFLLDVSGSMGAPDKLPLMVNSLRLLVNNMADTDSVAIVTYAGRSATLLEPTSGKDKHKILAALNSLNSGGSTAGAQGIRQAYALAQANFDKEAVNRVILATDGDFNVGIRDRKQLKDYIAGKRKTGIFLSILGFGRGNYNDALMQTLAQNGNGNAAYIDTLNEARKVLVEEAGSTLFPIAKDVKIQIEFNPKMVAEYRLIGYETRMLNRQDFNNDKIDAGDIGAGHTVTAIYEITPVGSAGQLVDPLRYQKKKLERVGDDTNHNEYAFLKIRSKKPTQDKSKLMSVPITTQMELGNISAAPADIRFAAAVTAFGQLLKKGAYTGDMSYEQVLELASSAKGKDEFGYRSEFLNLVRLAKSIQK